MFGTIQPTASSNGCHGLDADKTAKKGHLLLDSCHAIKNAPLELNIREMETRLFQKAIKNNYIKDIPSLKESILQHDRFHSLGMAVTTVANIDMINNAYPHAPIIVDAQTERTVKEICDNAPRDKAIDIGKDSAISHRGKAFISGFLAEPSPIDLTHYAVALDIGYRSQFNDIDPVMIDQFTGLWKIRSEPAKPVDIHYYSSCGDNV